MWQSRSGGSGGPVGWGRSVLIPFEWYWPGLSCGGVSVWGSVCRPMVRITPYLGLGSLSEYLKIVFPFTSCVR